MLPNRARRKSQWKTGHHFRAEAVEYLRAGGPATQKMARSILIPAAHAGSTPHSYKVHRPEHSLYKIMVKSGQNVYFIFYYVCLNWHKQHYNLHKNNTYICVLEDATVKPDTSSAAEQVLDFSSDKTSCFDGALSSAMEKKGRESLKSDTVHSNRDRDFLQTKQEINDYLLMER